jgi:hypothetical protein
MIYDHEYLAKRLDKASVEMGDPTLGVDMRCAAELIRELDRRVNTPAPEAAPTIVNFCYAKDASADIAWQTGLAELGDARLVWVNEGDIIMYGREHRVGDKPVPPLASSLRPQ